MHDTLDSASAVVCFAVHRLWFVLPGPVADELQSMSISGAVPGVVRVIAKAAFGRCISTSPDAPTRRFRSERRGCTASSGIRRCRGS
jgi:hypothetical protein